MLCFKTQQPGQRQHIQHSTAQHSTSQHSTAQHSSHTFQFYSNSIQKTKMSNPVVFFDSALLLLLLLLLSLSCRCFLLSSCYEAGIVEMYCLSLLFLSLFSIFPFFIISVPDFLSLSLSLSLSRLSPLSSLSSLFSLSDLRRYGHGSH